jgi:hypothetical protein
MLRAEARYEIRPSSLYKKREMAVSPDPRTVHCRWLASVTGFDDFGHRNRHHFASATPIRQAAGR